MKRALVLLPIFFFSSLLGQSIEEKLRELEQENQRDLEGRDPLVRVNQTISLLKKELTEKYAEIDLLIETGAEEEEYKTLLSEVKELRKEIEEVEEKWREEQSAEISHDSDAYGVWQHEEITIGQLVIEYGSGEYLYIIPPEIASLKLHLQSTLMIPKECQYPLVEVILKANGVGIKKINAFTRKLFLLNQDFTAVEEIINKPYQLEAIDPKTRIAYIFDPPAEHLKGAFYFLEKVRDPKSVFLYQVGPKIAMIGLKEDIKKLVVLCENVWEAKVAKVTKVVASTRLPASEIVKVLKAYFNGLADTARNMAIPKGGHDLSVIPLAQDVGVILIGSQDIVERAEQIIRETELQVEDPHELTVFWYSCSHTNPTELVQVLEQVYASLVRYNVEGEKKGEVHEAFADGFPVPPEPLPQGQDPSLPPSHPMFGRDMGAPFRAGGWESDPRKGFDGKEGAKPQTNFIPYPASGSILMVVRKDTLPKIKEILRKLDIPKRMVEIEVLLCERITNNSSRTGINLLKLGSEAANAAAMGAGFNAGGDGGSKGIFEFFFSSTKHKGIPAFDVTYNFLLSQEDVRVTASPSIIAINQTPATISITDQISINNGTAPVDTNSRTIFKESYERADFGITITLTPTIHEPSLGADPSEPIYITLDNDISFETIKQGANTSAGRPDVLKRHVKNQIRIADGQTIVLGGLKSKAAEDKNEKIPFLGEIPGLGKLFGTTAFNDRSNEMFIFIKPRIIQDPKSDLIRFREEKLRGRPGDSSYLLEKIGQARERKEARMFQKSFELFFGGRKDETLEL